MPKRKASFLIPEELYQEARDAVAFLGGPPHYLTLAQLAEDALRDKLDELKSSTTKGRRSQSSSVESKRVGPSALASIYPRSDS